MPHYTEFSVIPRIPYILQIFNCNSVSIVYWRSLISHERHLELHHIYKCIKVNG